MTADAVVDHPRGLIQPRGSSDPSAPTTRLAMLTVHTSPLEQPGTGDGGGLNVYVREVARRLAARGVTVDIWTRRTDADQPDVVALTDGVHVRHVTAGPVEPLTKQRLLPHLDEFTDGVLDATLTDTPDVIHGHYWLSGWIGSRLSEAWDVPFVQTFHTLGVVKNASLAPGDPPEPDVRLAAESSIAWSADRVLGLTCGEAGLLHDTYGLSGTRLAVVPPGVDTSLFHPAPEPLDSSATALLPVGDGPLLLFVGRLQPLKGPDVAVRTLAAVRETVPDARLLVVGGVSGSGAGTTGPDELRALAVSLRVADGLRVVAAQPQASLAALYRAADVVVVPSRSESFGLVALEAQACGTPVVGARVPGLEFIIRDGGLLVDGWEPVDHAAAVVSLLTDGDLASRIGNAGVAMGKSASWGRTVDRLLRVYGDVISARQPAAA